MIPEYYQGLEIIIIDDCSVDNTRDYLSEISAQYDFIKVVYNKKNFGVNYTRNRGIEIASNSYLMFIDSDDKLIKGSIQKIKNSLTNYPGRSHYLFLLSYRNHEYNDVVKPKEIFYEDWVKGNISGDFTHVVLKKIMKQYMFFEQFRMFEQLNWFRVFKATSPQLLIPVAVADIDVGRTDSLSVSQKLKSLSEVEAKFLSEKFFYELFYDDLKKHNEAFLMRPLLKNIVLGLACKRRNDARSLIKYTTKNYVRLAGNLLLLVPSELALMGVTSFSNLKKRLVSK